MSDTPSHQEFTISGMSCGHCRSAVEEAILEVPGVKLVQVDLEQSKAHVEGHVEADAIVAAVRDAGYDATPANSK